MECIRIPSSPAAIKCVGSRTRVHVETQVCANTSKLNNLQTVKWNMCYVHTLQNVHTKWPGGSRPTFEVSDSFGFLNKARCPGESMALTPNSCSQPFSSPFWPHSVPPVTLICMSKLYPCPLAMSCPVVTLRPKGIHTDGIIIKRMDP